MQRVSLDMKRFSQDGESEKRPRGTRRCTHGTRRARAPSSFIRTFTVGSGIAPDLLTFRRAEALAGSRNRRAYRRWGIAPRPEDVMECRRAGAWILPRGAGGRRETQRPGAFRRR
jgi:hypothetical protein